MKYKYRSYSYVLMIVCVLFTGYNMSAQSKIVSGKITSATDEYPLTGATIAEKDKNNRIINGVVTDFDGGYSIKMKDASNILTFSYVGFKTKEIVVGDKTMLNVQLEEDIDVLDVVLIKTRKKVFTGDFDMDKRRVATAMETISTKELSETVSTGIVDQLQGRLSGVDIVSNSGEPGAGLSIRIRGTSSLNGSSQPLIVINGVPFETEVDDLFDFGAADEEQYASLIGVSPDDIEEISVLKDAAATAQYGSRAGNGVLLIKTKRGTKGKARFSYSFKATSAWQPDGVPLLNGDQYATLIKDIYITDQNEDAGPEVEFDPNFELFELYNQNINWLDEITQKGHTQEHFLSVSGGGEKSRYRVSTSYKDQLGTTVGSGFKLFTTRAILDYDISDKITISSELAYSHGSLDRSYVRDQNFDSGSRSLRDLAIIKQPNQSIFDVDSEGNLTDQFFTPEDSFQGDGDVYYNPVAMARLSKNNTENNRISPIFRFNFKPNKQFDFRSIVSFDINVDKNKLFIPEEAFGINWTDKTANRSTFSDAEFFVLRTENKMIWSPKLSENHSFLSSFTFDTFEKTSKGYLVSGSNSPSSFIQTPIANIRIEGSGNSLQSTFIKFTTVAANFAFNYQYLDRYILSGGIRREGNSKFGSSFRYGNFPSVAGKWILSSEPFMESLEFIDELGFRASYGVNGTSPKNTNGQFNTYSTSNNNYLGVRPVSPDGIELTNLRWETVIQKNVGLTYSFLDNKISGDIEFYQKDTEDVLTERVGIPSTSGFSQLPFLNQGDISNKGFEFSVRTKLIQTENFKLGLNFNIARNVNTVERIAEFQDDDAGNVAETGAGGYIKRIQEGSAIGSFYGYRYLGVFSSSQDIVARDENGGEILDLNGEVKNLIFNGNYQFQAGDARYEDVNNDGNINSLDVVYLGNANPLFFGGFGPDITYKNFKLSAFFNFRYNQKLINIARLETESLSNLDNQSTAALRRWRFEGDVTDIPRADLDSPVNTLGSDRFLEDASFLRMKFITLRYNLPKPFLDKLNFTSASVYVTGTNLLTFTEYSGVDPESGNSSDWKRLGYDTNQTPRPEQVTVGLNLSF